MSLVARSAGAPTIVVDGASKTFRRERGGALIKALADVSFSAGANSFVTLFGPSGCGKTTMLRLLDGLLTPDEGTILVHDKAPTPGSDTGFVFQSSRLLPWRTVHDNVGFPLEIQGVGRRQVQARVRDILARVGLSDSADSYPSELSGGMRQRAALARALIVEPKLLLMDEPFAALDAQTREFMQLELLQLWQRIDCQVVFVTHSVDEAIVLSDRIFLMSPRPGRIMETIDVKLPRPRSESGLRGAPEFVRLRAYLWDQISQMVTSV